MEVVFRCEQNHLHHFHYRSSSMGSLTVNCWLGTTKDAHTTAAILAWRYSTLTSRSFTAFSDAHQFLPSKTSHGIKYNTCSFAKKSVEKPKRDRLVRDGSLSKDEVDQNDKLGTLLDSDGHNSSTVPSRSTVLQACTITSGFIAALGIVIRQVSHAASMEGLPILDCSTEVSFGFEMWHLELITGLVVLVSLNRYLLLKTWPDFAESSEAANRQVLTSLQPLDYIVVAFLPGISEELLFRGALVPLFGVNWKSIGAVALLFGVLHLGSGRKYSFAIWATFVGLVYGYATMLSSGIVVPMASHALNNLIGGILWRYTSEETWRKDDDDERYQS